MLYSNVDEISMNMVHFFYFSFVERKFRYHTKPLEMNNSVAFSIFKMLLI